MPSRSENEIYDNIIGLTVKENIERPPILTNLYGVCGSDEYSMQVNDCHWFKLKESPTNIILFPLNFLKKS